MGNIFREQRRSSIVMAVLTLLLGLLLMLAPIQSVRLLCGLLGAALLLVGLSYVRSWADVGRRQAGVPRWFLLPGLLLAALGLWLFTAPESAILLVQFSVAAVLLFHGVLDVQGANSLRRLGLRRWGVDLALGIVTLLLGAVVLLNPFGTMKALVVLIGLSLVYDGASDLYLIYRVSKTFRDGGDL